MIDTVVAMQCVLLQCSNQDSHERRNIVTRETCFAGVAEQVQECHHFCGHGALWSHWAGWFIYIPPPTRE